MTGNDLFREIGNINEKYVKEAEEAKRATILTPAFRRTIATAACLMICFGLYFGVRQLGLGGQSETASMESNTSTTTLQEDMAIKTESAVMDSATNSATGAGEESMYENTEEGTFWEELWPTQGDTVADCAPADTEVKQEATGMEGNVAEEVEIPETDAATKCEDAKVQNGELQNVLTFEADLHNDCVLLDGRDDVDAFLEKTANGEAAVLEMVQLFEDGTYVRATIRYTNEEFYEWTQWHEPSYGNDRGEEQITTVYGYLKVFEDMQEDGNTYCVVGLGEAEDFTLYDLQSGTEGTCFVLKYEK